ncbi:hypothetical protein AZE42_14182 [Rhizopogon vesiculosus]|uniref:Uncharacterized protein n=1 Tax=Rhizopogon vesiculosus TaxID=180088 RepID=A0A1J8QHF7_9AGAM|nr:hypothetical protein AZE42_14182 [Rhizopogon vesiculosus]
MLLPSPRPVVCSRPRNWLLQR